MIKQAYLKALMQQPAGWVLKSARNPSPYMTQTHIKLHYLALRRHDHG
jgi:hypothetical protein